MRRVTSWLESGGDGIHSANRYWPKKPIDYVAVRKLAALQCTQEEIASVLNLSVDTLTRDAKFCGAYKSAIDKGRVSLRRHQWKALAAGNTTMLVWLGKQYLGQRDRFEHEVTASEEGLALLAAASERARNGKNGG